MKLKQHARVDTNIEPAPVQPVGVSGAEYRRQWNKLNRARMRKIQSRWLKNHPEKQKKFPRSVRDKWQPLRKQKDQIRYRRNWEKAPNRRTRWTTAETNTLLTFTGTDRELSAILGRSISAIQLRRHVLKQAKATE
jgi:hypothetical protein